MIKFQDVSKTYDNKEYALNDASFEIDKGEFVFLVGASGSGKSTIIRLILREIQTTSGKIIIDDIEIEKLKYRQLPIYRRKLGMIFQDFRLIPTLTVFENVAFAMRVVEAPYRDIRKRVPMALSLVGLSGKYKSFPHELSGGEQQRVSIARAIVNNPSVVIADEPTGNLDPETAYEIMETLSDINKSGTTILMATHAKDIVDKLKKRVIAVEYGQIVRDQTKGLYETDDRIILPGNEGGVL